MSTFDSFSPSGALRERWDDATRLYTRWDDDGNQTSQRGYTDAENAAADQRAAVETAKANAAALKEKAKAALVDNAAFLALATPTTAQAVAQVKALTKQMNALIRLEVEALGNTDNT